MNGPLTYEVMAEDTIAYLELAAGGPAHLVGWSDGAVVALLVVQRRPELVAHMVLIGQYYNSSGRAVGSDLDRWKRCTKTQVVGMPIIQVAHEVANLKILAVPLACPMRWSARVVTVIPGQHRAGIATWLDSGKPSRGGDLMS